MNNKVSSDHGVYTECKEEDFLATVTKTKLVIAHFYHPEFARCSLMHEHLTGLAGKHFFTKFIKCDVNLLPFFVAKLKVRMLPTLVCFINGVAVDRVVGFEELGGTDDFTSAVLERRLAKANVIKLGGGMPGGEDGEEEASGSSRVRTGWTTMRIDDLDADNE